MEKLIKILPPEIIQCIGQINIENVVELRLRVNQKLRIKLLDKEITLDYLVKSQDMSEVLRRVSANSIYSIQDNINTGYITSYGGNRIGISGEVVQDEGIIKNIKNVTSMNIRVAHEVIGCSNLVMNKILNQGDVQNTLIVSPPGKGKTTMLRDVIRNISSLGKNVGVVDERYEIANVYQGKPTLNIGPRTDVMSGISKDNGINILVRSMGLDVIATDEIGSANDCKAIHNAVLCGVSVIATAHGNSYQDLPYDLQQLIDKGIFKVIIYLSNEIGKVEKLIDLGRSKECLSNVC